MKMLAAAFALALAAASAFAQETGYAVRQTEVKKEPFTDARTVGTLEERAQLKVLSRQGGWVQVESGALSGWVRMLSIRTNSGQASVVSGLKSLFNVARSGSSGTTVTTGVRGLDKEQIQNAKPNPEELRKLAALAVTKADAERWAAGSPPLKNQAVEYLPAPSGAQR